MDFRLNDEQLECQESPPVRARGHPAGRREARPRAERALGGHQGGPRVGAPRPRDIQRWAGPRRAHGVIYAEEMHWGCAGIALAIRAPRWPPPASPRPARPSRSARWVPECFGMGDEIKLGAYAVTEAERRLRRASRCAPPPSCDGDEWVLNGTKVFITNGGIADVTVVVATVDPELGHRGQASFIVPKGTPGPVAGQEGGQARHPRLADRRGRARGLPHPDGLPARRHRRSCRRSSSAPARAQSTGRSSNALATFEITRPLVGASALGIAQAAYEWTLEYLEDQRGGRRAAARAAARPAGARRRGDRDRGRTAARLARGLDGAQRRPDDRRPGLDVEAEGGRRGDVGHHHA